MEVVMSEPVWVRYIQWSLSAHLIDVFCSLTLPVVSQRLTSTCSVTGKTATRENSEHSFSALSLIHKHFSQTSYRRGLICSLKGVPTRSMPATASTINEIRWWLTDWSLGAHLTVKGRPSWCTSNSVLILFTDDNFTVINKSWLYLHLERGQWRQLMK